MKKLCRPSRAVVSYENVICFTVHYRGEVFKMRYHKKWASVVRQSFHIKCNCQPFFTYLCWNNTGAFKQFTNVYLFLNCICLETNIWDSCIDSLLPSSVFRTFEIVLFRKKLWDNIGVTLISPISKNTRLLILKLIIVINKELVNALHYRPLRFENPRDWWIPHA